MVLTLGAMGFLAAWRIKEDQTERIKKELFSFAQIIALMPDKEIDKNIFPIAKMSQTRITLINPFGTVIADSEADVKKMDNHLNRSEIQQARVIGKGEATHFSHTLGVDMLYLAIPIKEKGEIKSYIRLARPLFAVEAAIDQLIKSIYHAAFIVVLPALLIAFLFSVKLISPIRKMAAFTQKVRKDEKPGILMVDSKDEIGQLSENINYMLIELHERLRTAIEEKRKLETAFASMKEGIIILDSMFRIEVINNGMRDLLGGHYDDITGKTLLEAFRNVELQDALECFRREKKPVLREIALGEGPFIILDVSISAIEELPGNEEKTILVFHDVTRLKKLEVIKADFVANVTHEIKTPLTAIIGFADTLQEGATEDSEVTRKFLQTISDNARRLNRLVDDLLILSSIELGDVQLRLEDIKVFHIVNNVLEIIEPRVLEKSIKVMRDIPVDLPPLRADWDKVCQVLLNILDNAVKFTPQGGEIRIGTIVSEKYIVVTVTDTGVGIPRSDLPRLGERFYRVDKTRSRELGGTGLGLSIVKHLMEIMHGRMEINSRLGEGTTVSLYFPASLPHQST
jgi:two-component system phosphate regulon sensor histidine kinase PhoR